MKQLLAVLFSIFLFVAPAVLHAQSKPEDRFEIYQDGRHGYINREGQVVIEPTLENTYVITFSDGLAKFAETIKPLPKLPYADKDGHAHFSPPEKWGFIDTSGNIVVPAKFDEVTPFSEGLAAVYLDDGLGWGFIDRQGQMVIQRQGQFYGTDQFSEGLAAVKNADGKWGYIDVTGKIVIPYSFKRADAFSNGLAAVTVNGQTGYIDKTGVIAIRGRFMDMRDFSEGLAAVRISGRPDKGAQLRPTGGRWSFIGKDGTTKIKLGRRVEVANDFREGMAVVEYSGGRCGFIDLSGTPVVPARYAACNDFSEGLAAVFDGGKWQYIDKTGRTALAVSYWGVHDFKNGLAEIEEGGVGPQQKFGYINNVGKVVWQPRPAL